MEKKKSGVKKKCKINGLETEYFSHWICFHTGSLFLQ